MSEGRARHHRLHYHWTQLEADKCRSNLGSPSHPLPTVDRTLILNPECEYKCYPFSADAQEMISTGAHFSNVSWTYKTIEYNTFYKNGLIKLTEVELYWLCQHMTRASSGEYFLVYLGIGNGERFRYIRDDFFPDLTVLSYDPFEDGPNYIADTSTAHRNAKLWNDDGTNFTFHVRCFDMDKDVPDILEKSKGKKLLLISDIRGCAVAEDGKTLNKMADLNLQWEAIERLRPVSSLCKFDAPDSKQQFFEYAPGILLKQVFCFYGTCETRLWIKGVPEKKRRYNTWELYKKMRDHHDHVRGQCYKTTHNGDCPPCFDSCFDCTVLWNTVSMYARQNSMNPQCLMRTLVHNHIYTPRLEEMLEGGYDNYKWIAPALSRRWRDTEFFIKDGKLTEVEAALWVNGDGKNEDADWRDISECLTKCQPCLEWRIKESLPKQATRTQLMQLLGSLTEPFTLVRSDLNGLLEKEERQSDEELEQEEQEEDNDNKGEEQN